MDSLAGQVSFWLYGLSAIATILIGLLYASRKQVMPYHLDALETTWEAIDPNYKRLLLALLNGGGYYGISVGLFIIALLAMPFRNGDAWAGYAIGLIGLVGTFPLGYIVYTIKKHTAGNPPLGVMVVINMLMIGGLIAFLLA